VGFDRFGQLDDPVNLAADRPAVPALEEDFRLLAAFGKIDELQAQLENVGLDAPQVEAGQAAQPLLLLVRQAIGVLQEQVAGLAQLFGKLTGFFRADLAQHVVHQLDDVELVEGQHRVGELLLQSLDEGFGHVDAGVGDGFRVATMGREIGHEALHRRMVLAMSAKQQLACVHVEKEGDIVMPPPGTGFIGTQTGHAGVVLVGSGGIDIATNDAPQSGVVDLQQLRDGIDRHLSSQGHHQSLEQQGKPGTGTGPRHDHLLDATTLVGAVGAWHPGRQIGFVLEEVQMPPALLGRIVNRSVGSTNGADELGASREIDADVEPLILLREVDADNLPGGSNSKGNGKKRFRIH